MTSPKSFLPEGETIPASNGKYTRFKSGDNKIRILASAITGWELWINGKPVRRKTPNLFTTEELANADINTFTNKKKTPQYFWAFPVYNYDTTNIEILEVTQKRIRDGILGLLNDEDYGPEPWQYDLVINRNDDSDPVQYSVRPKPPKPLEEDLAETCKDAIKDINLTALFNGGDPFEIGIDFDEADRAISETK